MSWPLIDLLLVPDTCHGILVLAGPNIHTENWTHGSQIVSFSVDPVTLLQWGSTAQALTHEAPDSSTQASGRFKATPRLRSRRGEEFVTLVRPPGRVPEHRQLQFIAADSASGIQWKTFASVEHVNRLLATIEDVVARAPAPRPRTDTTLVDDQDTDVEPVVQLSVPIPGYPATSFARPEQGRVWAEYIVGTDGRVERGSIRILLADREEFGRAAVAALEKGKFRPATRRGALVRQRVFQAVHFRVGS